MPPQAAGGRFQRSNTHYQNRGGYDTYGVSDSYGKDDEEQEDYRNYKRAQQKDDPWRRSGTQREHSIGSDFDNDGKDKKKE